TGSFRPSSARESRSEFPLVSLRQEASTKSRLLHGETEPSAEGVTNIFVKDWKKEFFSDPKKKVASIPFIRNMIEYTRGTTDPEYIKLTSLLHWKESDTGKITIGELDKAFQSIFGGAGKSADAEKPVAQVLTVRCG